MIEETPVSTRDVIIFDTHPVQYRAPIYAGLYERVGDRFEVVYASDMSVRGYRDEGFGARIEWDTPLVAGYPHRFLPGLDTGHGFRKHPRDGVRAVIAERRPKAVIVHGTHFEYYLAAMFFAKLVGAKVWLRAETQDGVFRRSRLKDMLRTAALRGLYSFLDRAFYFGELNRRHLLRMGVAEGKLRPTLFSVSDPVRALSHAQKVERRARLRQRLGIADTTTAIAFVGKFIVQKNPGALLRAIEQTTPGALGDAMLLWVGSGPLEGELRAQAEAVERDHAIPSRFVGFVNQRELPDYFLAADVMVLPSVSETWGLVVNEALQAGCRVVMTDAVGSYPDFGPLSGVEVVPARDDRALAAAIERLAPMARDFDWAARHMEAYSTEAAVDTLAREIEPL